jgi:hypothetical protein
MGGNMERIGELQRELSDVHIRGREIQAELSTLWAQELAPKPNISVTESAVVGYMSLPSQIARSNERARDNK